MHGLETSAPTLPAVILAAKGSIEQIVSEVARFGVVDLLIVGLRSSEMPDLARFSGLAVRSLSIEDTDEKDSLALLHRAREEMPPRFLLVDASALWEVNFLALPLTGFPTLSWSSDIDRPAGSAWLSTKVLDTLPPSGSVWQALASYPGMAKHPVHGRYLGTKQGSIPTARPAAFLDRDGVLIIDDGYPHDPAKVQWIPGAVAAVRQLNEEGYFVFVVTNQAGVARGYYTEEAVQHLHRWMAKQLAEAGAHIDAFAYCPHHPEATVKAYRQICCCRKPAPGMILDFIANWPVKPAQSFLIGDRFTDIAAAKAAGIRGFLFSSSNLDKEIDHVLKQERQLFSPK